MKFLYKLYDTEYFGITLFVVIAVLIFLFLIILFFGKKDEKKKIEQTQKLDLDKNAFKEEDTKKDLEIPEVEQPTIEKEDLSNLFDDDNHDELVAKIKAEMEKAAKDIKDIKPETVVVLPDEDTTEVPVIEDVFDEEIPSENIFTVEDTVEEPKEEVKPSFELPKMADMPKLKDDTPAMEEKKVEPVKEKEETVSDFDKLFGEIESETYNINK